MEVKTVRGAQQSPYRDLDFFGTFLIKQKSTESKEKRHASGLC